MTAHAITITLPTWLRRPSAPAPGDSGWQAAVAALRQELAADRQAHADATAALRTELDTTRTELAAARAETTLERGERERLKSYSEMLYKSIEKWERLSFEQADAIGQLRGQLKTSEHGRELQGQRISALEQLVKELPPLRDRALRAEMIARIWRDDAAGLRRAMETAGLTPPAAPAIPDVPDAEAAS